MRKHLPLCRMKPFVHLVRHGGWFLLFSIFAADLSFTLFLSVKNYFEKSVSSSIFFLASLCRIQTLSILRRSEMREISDEWYQMHVSQFSQNFSFLCSFGHTFCQIIGWLTPSGVGASLWKILDSPLMTCQRHFENSVKFYEYFTIVYFYIILHLHPNRFLWLNECKEK